MTTREAIKSGFEIGVRVVAVTDVLDSGTTIIYGNEIGIIKEIDKFDNHLPVRVYWENQHDSWWCHWNDLALLEDQTDDAEDELVVYDIDQLLFGAE